jgi:hypothetical protein
LSVVQFETSRLIDIRQFCSRPPEQIIEHDQPGRVRIYVCVDKNSSREFVFALAAGSGGFEYLDARRAVCALEEV